MHGSSSSLSSAHSSSPFLSNQVSSEDEDALLGVGIAEKSVPTPSPRQAPPQPAPRKSLETASVDRQRQQELDVVKRKSNDGQTEPVLRDTPNQRSQVGSLNHYRCI